MAEEIGHQNKAGAVAEETGGGGECDGPGRALFLSLSSPFYRPQRESGVVLQCIVVFCSVLQCVAVCCSVLQCVAVCCSMLLSL